jgi:hypothetical protein
MLAGLAILFFASASAASVVVVVLAVCPALPDIRVVNGQWPLSCTDTTVGSSCTALCNPGEF